LEWEYEVGLRRETSEIKRPYKTRLVCEYFLRIVFDMAYVFRPKS